MAQNSMLDGVKIQAHVVIPIVKALEAELGKDKAHSIVGKAIAESWAKFTASRTPYRNTHPGEAKPDLGYQGGEIVDHTDTTFGVNFTQCPFAEYFRRIGEPEIGALLTCNLDFAVERKLRPEWEFQRSQTQMEGAPFCDFRWRQRG